MKSVHVRDVPLETLEALRRLARANRRSLQGELRDILVRAARQAPPASESGELDLVTVRTGHNSNMRREGIYGDPGR
jgi:hypothetical protein